MYQLSSCIRGKAVGMSKWDAVVCDPPSDRLIAIHHCGVSRILTCLLLVESLVRTHQLSHSENLTLSHQLAPRYTLRLNLKIDGTVNSCDYLRIYVINCRVLGTVLVLMLWGRYIGEQESCITSLLKKYIYVTGGLLIMHNRKIQIDTNI